MKNKIKKILTASIVSAVSITAIGCASNNNKLAKNIDNSMANFVTSINNLDYVETGKNSSNEKIGKIVETSSRISDDDKYVTKTNSDSPVRYLNKNSNYSNIESTITRPEERSDNFKLFVLSDSPYITLTSSDNKANLNINLKFSTEKIEATSTEIQEKINKLILKRSILMIYVNEIYNGNVNLSEENKVAIGAYVNVIKENTSYLNGNRGMVKNQLKLAKNLAESESNNNLVNYYMIKSGEALETRLSKLESSISAIDSIIDIIENNLTSNSSYYQTNLSNTYDNFLSNLSSKSYTDEQNSSNIEIAKNIAETLEFANFDTKTYENCKICENKNSEHLANRLLKKAETGLEEENQNQNNSNLTATINNKTNNSTNRISSIRNIKSSTNGNNNTDEQSNNNDISNSNSTRTNNTIRTTPSTTNQDRVRTINRRSNQNKATTNTKSNLRSTSKQDLINNSLSNNDEKENKEDNRMNNPRIMRARRTPEQQKQEEYTSSRSNTNLDINGRVKNVPFVNSSN